VLLPLYVWLGGFGRADPLIVPFILFVVFLPIADAIDRRAAR
jgi:hypothetical protein